MSAPQFTPAPWSIKGQYIQGPGDNGNVARAVEYVGDFRAEGEANARLIAAAPELYEALKGLVSYAEAVRHTAGMGKSQLARLESARAALAKAVQQ